jgi:hypothetical protein
MVPNPARTLVRLSTDTEQYLTEIRVFNSQGVLVLNQTIAPTTSYELDIRSLQPGIYIIQAMDEDRGRHHARLACVR